MLYTYEYYVIYKSHLTQDGRVRWGRWGAEVWEWKPGEWEGDMGPSWGWDEFEGEMEK